MGVDVYLFKRDVIKSLGLKCKPSTLLYSFLKLLLLIQAKSQSFFEYHSKHVWGCYLEQSFPNYVNTTVGYVGYWLYCQAEDPQQKSRQRQNLYKGASNQYREGWGHFLVQFCGVPGKTRFPQLVKTLYCCPCCTNPKALNDFKLLMYKNYKAGQCAKPIMR